jgi:zinc and cadmium transporter
MPQLIAFQWHPYGTVIAYTGAVILASILGGMLPEWIRLTHNKMQLMISFVGGVMLGIAVFHMIPHAAATLGPSKIDQVAWGIMLGLLATFFLLRIFHFHQHGPADFGILADEQRSNDDEHTHLCSEHNHPAAIDRSDTHADSQSHNHSECNHAPSAGPTRWILVLVGLGLHTLMDGVAVGAGVVADLQHDATGLLPGFGIFLAVLLHKPLDAVSITSLMHPVTSPAKRLAVNVGFAMMCPLGAILFLLGTNMTSVGWAGIFAGWGLAFSAGVFLCISLSDLLPEMEFHSHNRVRLSVALLLGIFAAWAIGLAEGEHAHVHSGSEAVEASGHVHGSEDGHKH